MKMSYSSEEDAMKLSCGQITLSLLLVAILTTCSTIPAAIPTSQPAPINGGDPVKLTSLHSNKTRVEAPEAEPGDVTALAGDNTAFAFDLYQHLAGEKGNLFYSPYSISMALAMVEAGARGDTLAEINQAMHFTLPQDRLPVAFNALDQAIKQRAAKIPESNKDHPFQLNIANATWTQKDYAILPQYLDLLAQQYGAGVDQVDFTRNSEAARQAINQWVENQTQRKIQNMIPAGLINDSTRMVLVNAIYFNASWLYPFNQEATRDEAFTQMDGSQVTAPMMHTSRLMGYAKGEGYQVVELPYISTNLVMDVIVPDAGRFAEVEPSLSGKSVTAMLGQIRETEVDLGLPKFKYEDQIELKPVLEAMGMQLAFTPGAPDFSGMTTDPNMYLQEVLHKAYVSVDENGTEAAATTAVMAGITAMPLEKVKLTVDRPFIFLIRDRENGAILFLGRVASI
jgi:serpin B